MSRTVYAIATMDTKGVENAFVARCLREAGVPTKLVDVGTLSLPTVEPDIARDTILSGRSLRPDDRGGCVTVMGEALAEFLQFELAAGRLAGVIGIGGSGGTALITAAMRKLPIGVPKMMVSTVASGNTAPYVDCSDITMMYSVVDIAGLNRVALRILSNAAHAMAGMASHAVAVNESRPCVGMTMFGVTTPCVTQVRQSLESQVDCLVFHATGTGGRAMEMLVKSGLISGVLDITTTEVADEIVGGVFPCGSDRFDAVCEHRIPCVMSLGALDMVNFGAMDCVPAPFRNRLLHMHNQQVTLMRTNKDESRQIGHWMAQKLNRSTAPLSLVIPERGVSSLDAVGQPFYDPAANAVLYDVLESQVQQTAIRKIIRAPFHINDIEFSRVLLSEFKSIFVAQDSNRET